MPFVLGVMNCGLMGVETPLYINDSLIGATPELQLKGLSGQDELSVNEKVNFSEKTSAYIA